MLKGLVNKLLNGKGGEKAMASPVHSLGPWFLPREYPPAPFVSYGEWKRRFDAAEFSVANMAAENVFPSQNVLDSMGAYVSGKSRDLPKGSGDNPFIEALRIMSDPSPLRGPYVAIIDTWKGFFPEVAPKERDTLEDALRKLHAAAVSLCACKLGSRQAELMGRLYEDAQSLLGAGGRPYLRLLASKFLQENGMSMLWQNYAYERGWLAALKCDRPGQAASLFMDLMRPD